MLTYFVDPAESESIPDTIEVARYVGQMLGELEIMAAEAKLDLLAYFLRMARAEATSVGEGPKPSAFDRSGAGDV